MSIDATWSAKKPGLLPPAVIRAAIEEARTKWAPLELSIDEDEADALGDYGAECEVQVGDLGTLFLYQPEAVDEVFHLAIDTSTSPHESESFDQLSEIADVMAKGLGLRFDDGSQIETLEARTRAKHSVSVTSVRIEIGLDDGTTRTVELKGDPLSTIAADAVEDLEPAVRDAVSWAIEFSERAVGEPTIDDIAAWLEEEMMIERGDGEDEDLITIIPDDRPRFVLMLEDGFVTVSASLQVDLDLEHALEMNIKKLRNGALGLGENGEWLLWARTHVVGLDPTRLIDWLRAFLEDIGDVFIEEGEDGDDLAN